MIKTLLWDIDGTLLDFTAAEKNALRACFTAFCLGECPDALIARYAKINQTYWRRLERGEITKDQVLKGRFEEFFATEAIDCQDIPGFNREYQVRLGDTICFFDQGYELVKELSADYRQYAVTNGTYTAQQRKLKKSGLDQLFQGVFISDLIGAEKPSPDFFDYVFDHIPPCEKQEILIIGDSLTGDIQGGNNAGIRCCWYNPQKKSNTTDLNIDYTIENLNQIKAILKK